MGPGPRHPTEGTLVQEGEGHGGTNGGTGGLGERRLEDESPLGPSVGDGKGFGSAFVGEAVRLGVLGRTAIGCGINPLAHTCGVIG